MEERLVPALRFKDENGQDYPDWNSKLLGQILEIGSGRDHKHLLDGDIPVYGSGGVMRHVDTFIYEGESVGIGRKGTIDNPVLLEGKFWTVDTLFYTHSFVSLLPRFLYNLFKTIEWYRYNEASGVPSLSKSTIERIRVSLPTITEQQKIADFLSSVDKKIEQLTRKKELLEKYKTGMMQKLFPKAGEQHPELRFKDENGQDFPDWREFKLSDFSKVIDPHPSHRAPKEVFDGIPFIGIGDISEDGKIDTSNVRTVSPSIYDEHILRYKIQKGDFAFGRVASVGKIISLDSLIDEKITFSPTMAIIKPIGIYGLILKYILQSPFVIREIENLTTGSTRKSLGLQKFRKLPIKICCDLEQQKIADFLSAIDDKITKVEGKLTKVQTFKKGLLQQMFV